VVNGAPQRLEPGTLFLLSPADLHALEATGSGPLLVLNAVLRTDMVEAVIDSLGATGEARLPWSAMLPGADQDVQRIRLECQTRSPGWDVVVEGALGGLLVALARACVSGRVEATAAGVSTSASAVRRAVQFVDRHFREPLTLAQVAGVAHLSPHWFSERFRRTTGVSFQEYLRSRRLGFARALLGSTDLTVTEVCHAAGFNDPSYFGRAYRARYGEPPSGRGRPRPGADGPATLR
jgi:AraC-like DNA-binding protein